MKRILTIQDISCVGKCSLTVALPIISATGDVFSSAFTGLLLRGKSVLDSVKIAADFTAKSIRLTKETPGSNWYGVDFERVLPYLIERIDAK
jgi:hydroxymethylpyrimidine/phosphomethylpyrimidine kinase